MGYYRSNIDEQPSRYNIIGRKEDLNNYFAVGKTKYEKDPKPYYPNEPKPELVLSKNVSLRNIPRPKEKVDISLPYTETNRPKVYELDSNPYYSPFTIFEKVKNPEPPKGKPVNVVYDTPELTFPSEKNLLILKEKLKNLKLKALNAINGKVVNEGVYIPDPKPYYDPTVMDTNQNISNLENKVIQMEKNLNDNLKENVEDQLNRTMEIKTKIEHQKNINAEKTNQYIMDTKYTPIAVHSKKGYHVELPVGTPSAKKNKTNEDVE